MLPKAKRMKGDDIALLFSRAKTLKNPLFLIKYTKNEANTAFFAVAASKKVFKTAVLRNKVRRRIYNALRSTDIISLPYSIVFIPNIEAIEAPYSALVSAIDTSCKSLKKS
jgi:ribonuclease P protein component